MVQPLEIESVKGTKTYSDGQAAIAPQVCLHMYSFIIKYLQFHGTAGCFSGVLFAKSLHAACVVLFAKSLQSLV